MTGLTKIENKDLFHFSPDGNFALLLNDKGNDISGEDTLFIKEDYIIQVSSPLYRMISKGQIKKVNDGIPLDNGLVGYKFYKKLVSNTNEINKKKISKFPYLENDCLGFAECLTTGFTDIDPDKEVLKSRDLGITFGESDEKNIQIAKQTDPKYTNNNAIPEQGETYAIVTMNDGDHIITDTDITPFHAATVIYQTPDGKTNVTLEAFADSKDQFPRFKLYTTDPDSEDTFHKNWMKDTTPGGFNKNPEQPKITIVLKDKHT
jgi:hypothetical protein